ncbi:hypothetical protein K503DRAFT_151388 [Rhizopogon vinicolor AM-OR11-026]|uniref:Uncharacterized protein n=1 Tax=Rhizopogon vinicolor AM-OR11-026 TaxID=1314800 RepID=A0A1B7N181_9AGAM|nr:hypothetical protein K503DRAFT_151388 [Rhizopogon vinicolor AM-OR11-026]
MTFKALVKSDYRCLCVADTSLQQNFCSTPQHTLLIPSATMVYNRKSRRPMLLLLEFRGCANDERRNGIGREPFANAQRFSTRRKISHAKCEGLQQRPKYSDNSLMSSHAEEWNTRIVRASRHSRLVTLVRTGPIAETVLLKTDEKINLLYYILS